MSEAAGKIKFAAIVVAVVLAWWWAPVVCPVLIAVGAITLVSLGLSKVWAIAAIAGAGFAWPYGAIALAAGFGIAFGPPNPWLPGGQYPLPVYAHVTDIQYSWASPRGAAIGATIAVIVLIWLIGYLAKLGRKAAVIDRETAPSIAQAMMEQGQYDGYRTIDISTGILIGGDEEVEHHPAPGTSPAGSPTEPDRRPRVPARPVPIPVHDAWVDFAVDPAHLFGDLQVALVDQNIEYQTPRKCLLRLHPQDIPQVDQILANLRAQAG